MVLNGMNVVSGKETKSKVSRVIMLWFWVKKVSEKNFVSFFRAWIRYWQHILRQVFVKYGKPEVL